MQIIRFQVAVLGDLSNYGFTGAHRVIPLIKYGRRVQCIAY